MHGHPQFKRTRKLGKEIAKSTAEDVRHPGRNPGFLLLDTLAAASAGAGTAARIGAAGKAVAEGGRVGAVAKALAHARSRSSAASAVPWREGEQVARDLKRIYPPSTPAAQAALEAFDEKWGARLPVITQAWLNAWEYATPFLAFPPELRRVVYTADPIEELNRQLRKAIKTKGHFPNEEAARKLIYLAITNAVPAWTRTRNWTTALLAFKIHFGDRLPE